MLPTHVRSSCTLDAVPHRPTAVAATPAAIAHDLKNLLGVMQGTLFLMAEEATGASPIARDVGDLAELVERAIGLTRQLTTKAAATPATVVATSPRDVLAVVARFARRIVPAGVHLEVEATGELPPITVDRYRLEQAMLNLIVNAVHAVSAGGTIRLAARHGVSASPCARTPHVVFSVTDDGHGIPESLQARVLEPYFSTKPAGLGTGLGLPSVSETARAFGGWLEIESASGLGTSVRLCLPTTSRTLN